MAKILTKKQQTILTLIFTFRFINSKQLQTFLQHKDHRRINAWLKDLVEKEYIDRDFTPIYGTLTKPAVYFLARKGRDYTRNEYGGWQEHYLARLREDRKRSKGFRIRCQIVVDCFLILFADQVAQYPQIITEQFIEGETLPSKQFHFFTPALYEELDFMLLPHLKPDAYGYLKKSKRTTHALFYVLDAYIPRMMLRNYLKRIFTVLDEENWESENIQSLQFYFICPNNMVIIYLKRFLSSFLDNYYGKKLVFNFATRNQLYNKQKTNAASTGWITVSSSN
ncbi:MAG TPA: replication-relaxation family protein [Patescibacteria group bacterium]|nr:replication-relaxation family protein [Patescibacteria group bacterium]